MAADLSFVNSGSGFHRNRAAGTSAAKPAAGVWATTGRFLNLVVLMIAVFAALVLIVVPKATGSETYTVLTNSMAPKFPPGTFLVMKPAPFDDLKYGDVVTFQLTTEDHDRFAEAFTAPGPDEVAGIPSPPPPSPFSSWPAWASSRWPSLPRID